MKTKTLRKPRHNGRRTPRGVLPPGVVQLCGERLEERTLMASDLAFTNPNNAFDVNADGYANRRDVLSLVADLRGQGERQLTSVVAGEGEVAASAPTYVDVNGDGFADRRDAFAVVGHLRAEGEQNPAAGAALLKYELHVFTADGLTELVDPDGAGPLNIPIGLNSEFLLRVFVQDPVVRPTAGIGTFALDVNYGIGNTALATPFDNAAPAHFEGTGAVSPSGQQFVTPTGNVDPVYNFTQLFPGTVSASTSTIQNIFAITNNTPPPPFNGNGSILALEIPFQVGPSLGTFSISTLISSARNPSNPNPDLGFFNSTQDAGPPPVGNPDFPDTTDIPDSRVDDDLIRLDIVNSIQAITDIKNVFEQAPQVVPPGVNPPGTLPNDIKLDVLGNDVSPGPSSRFKKDILSFSQPTRGVVTQDRGADNVLGTADDFFWYRPNANTEFQFEQGIQNDSFFYVMRVQDNTLPAGNQTIGTSQATVTINFRDKNFDPIFVPDPALSVDQGNTLIIPAASVLGNDHPGIVGIPPTGSNEEAPSPRAQTLRIENPVLSDPNAGTVSVVAGNIEFNSKPTFAGLVNITYDVVDDGAEQELATGNLEPANIANKRVPGTISVDVINVTDRARFTIKFFDTLGADLQNEVNTDTPFVARVFATDISGNAIAGVETAFIDLLYAPVGLGTGVDTSPVSNDVTKITVSNVAPFAPYNVLPEQHFSVPPPNGLIDNTGGTTAAANGAGDAPVFEIALRSGTSSNVSVVFSPLFAENQGTLTTGINSFVKLIADALKLDENQIEFVPATLLIAKGVKPVVFNDFYTVAEDTTLTVTDAGSVDGSGVSPVGRPGPFGVIDNDTDADFPADPGNTPIRAQIDIPSLVGIQHGTLQLRDATNAANLVTVVSNTNGHVVTAPPAGFVWDGTFVYIPTPNSNFFGAETFGYRAADNNGRRSANVATATINITSVNDVPVARPDAYDIGVRFNAVDPPTAVNDPGRTDGSGAATGAIQTKGVLDNDSDADRLGPQPPAALTATLLNGVPDFSAASSTSGPHLGTLKLHKQGAAFNYADNTTFFTLFTSATPASAANFAVAQAAGFVWDGAFEYTPDVGERAVIDRFQYFAVDENGAPSAASTEVQLRIGLRDVHISGVVYVDDGDGDFVAPYGPDGKFNFLDVNTNNKFDFTDLNGDGELNFVDVDGNGDFDPAIDIAEPADVPIERLLGGVTIMLVGTESGTNLAVRRTAVTDAAGRFSFGINPAEAPLRAGNYSLIESPADVNAVNPVPGGAQNPLRFFIDGLEGVGTIADGRTFNGAPIVSLGATSFLGTTSFPTIPSQATPVFDATVTNDMFTNISADALDVAFGEFGLLPQFINPFDPTLTIRDAVTFGLDAQGNMLWYAIDKGTGWNVFQHQITSANLANNLLTIEVETATGTTTLHVPTGSPAIRVQGIDPAGRGQVVRLLGTFDLLRTAFP